MQIADCYPATLFQSEYARFWMLKKVENQFKTLDDNFSMKPNFDTRFDFSFKPNFRIRFDFSINLFWKTLTNDDEDEMR